VSCGTAALERWKHRSRLHSAVSAYTCARGVVPLVSGASRVEGIRQGWVLSGWSVQQSLSISQQTASAWALKGPVLLVCWLCFSSAVQERITYGFGLGCREDLQATATRLAKQRYKCFEHQRVGLQRLRVVRTDEHQRPHSVLHQ
jgi:hypothetical protein